MEQLPINLIRDTERLRVWEHRGASDRLVLCFSGIGDDPEMLPGYQFASVASGRGADTVLFIADPVRSWLNAPGLIEEIVELVEEHAARIGARRICSLGTSMGGFCACVIAGFTRVDTAVAMSPQYSVSPDVVPDEHRWMNYRERIADFRIRSVAEHLSAATSYYAFFGRHGREAPQRDRFPGGENIQMFVLPHTHHNVAQKLKRTGILAEVVQAAFDQRKWRVKRLVKRTLGGRMVTTPDVAAE